MSVMSGASDPIPAPELLVKLVATAT